MLKNKVTLLVMTASGIPVSILFLKCTAVTEKDATALTTLICG